MDDSISRQQAIDLINARLSQPCKNHTSEFVQGMEDGYCRIRSDIKCLPSAQPHWIPCSERLPDKENLYLVTVHKDYLPPKYLPVDMFYWDGKKWWLIHTDKDMVCNIPITAWMPLPKPYGGESDE